MSFEGERYKSEEVPGEVPANIDHIPGSIGLDHVASPNGLKKVAGDYLQKNPTIKTQALAKGKDIIAVVSSHGKEILIGVGIAGVVGSVSVGGIILYRHRQTHPHDK